MTRAVGDDGAMLQSLQEVVALFREAQTSVFKLMSSVRLLAAHGISGHPLADSNLQDSVPKFLKEPKYAVMLAQHNFDHASSVPLVQATAVQPERSKSRVVRDARA